MVQADHHVHMEDRIEVLGGIPARQIAETGFDWFLEDDYLVNEAIRLESAEIDKLNDIANKTFDLFIKMVEHVIDEAHWEPFDLPLTMREMVIDSWNKGHSHLLGRFDIAGVLNGMPGKVIEFNADTSTILPETAFFQYFFKEEFYPKDWILFDKLYDNLVDAFKRLKKENPNLDPSILVCSLGYGEDKLNAEVIRRAAEDAGFKADYSDLEYVIFEPDGVYLEFENGTEYRYDYFYKLVPWEFIMFEEPELLEILRNLQLNNVLYILNPAYSILMQSKAMLPLLWDRFKEPFLLETNFDKNYFTGRAYVEKVTYGRMGENIKILDNKGEVVEETGGDWGQFRRIYQEFASLYKDQDFEYYQAGLYMVDGESSGLSFRRAERMIIDDDAEFIPHFVKK